jgi:hypothetical protein
MLYFGVRFGHNSVCTVSHLVAFRPAIIASDDAIPTTMEFSGTPSILSTVGCKLSSLFLKPPMQTLFFSIFARSPQSNSRLLINLRQTGGV